MALLAQFLRTLRQRARYVVSIVALSYNYQHLPTYSSTTIGLSLLSPYFSGSNSPFRQITERGYRTSNASIDRRGD